MPQASIAAYMERLPRRQYELRNILVEVTSYPHMKEEHRRDADRNWRDIVGGEAARPKATPALLAAHGIGIRMVRRKGKQPKKE